MKKPTNHPATDLKEIPAVLGEINFYRRKFSKTKQLNNHENENLKDLYLRIKNLAQNTILFGSESHTQYLHSISEVINNFLRPERNNYREKITPQKINLQTFSKAKVVENIRVKTVLRTSMQTLRYQGEVGKYVQTLQNEALSIGFDSEDEIELPQKMLDFTYSQTQIENIINEQRRERNEEFIAKMLEGLLWDAFVLYHELLNRQSKVAGKIKKRCSEPPDHLLVVVTYDKKNPQFKVGESMMTSGKILAKKPAENLAQIVQQSINSFEEIGLEHDFLLRRKVLEAAASVGLKSGIFKS